MARGSIALDQIQDTARQGTGDRLVTGDGTYTAGHVPVYDSTGKLIDSGVAPGGGIAYVQEAPVGAMNGANHGFTLSFAPNAGSLNLCLNGVGQTPGADYSISGSTITYTVAPKASDQHVAQYAH